MYLHNIGILLVMITCIKAEMWKFPTAIDVETSLETCGIKNLNFLNVRGAHKTDTSSVGNSHIRCLTRQLGLWSDDEGFRAKRFVKILKKQRQPIEIIVVVDYCNNVHKQANLDKWANEAFYCFARGSMGVWLSEYMKNIYKKKLTNTDK